ncbi:MAG: hypothetical protein M3167_06050 [Acidobacteriota bacterium]|nr:hypothetical protein [Acidobacteriota bacterium]
MPKHVCSAFCPVHPHIRLICPGCTAAKGASNRTAKQRAAARRNGRKGGRPAAAAGA